MIRAAMISVLALLLGAVPVGAGSPREGAPVNLSMSSARSHAKMLHYPDVSATHIVFVFGNDLWLVPREGGVAQRLTQSPGVKIVPKFSPDGHTLVFTGNYDGVWSLYTLPVTGGAPTRVTHHPSYGSLSSPAWQAWGAVFMNDWTPDGKLIFNTWGLDQPVSKHQIYTVPSKGGLPTRLPVPYGAYGAISPDGRWLAYTPYPRVMPLFGRLPGGFADDIWLLNLRTHASRKIPRAEGTNTMPMWHGNTVYYLSDAGPERRLNIWSYELSNRQQRQITRLTEYNLEWPSVGPGPKGQGEIVFQYGADLMLLDLGTLRAHPVVVSIPEEPGTLRPHTVDASKYISGWSLSPTGQQAVVEARGDLWIVPAPARIDAAKGSDAAQEGDHGAPRNLTHTSGIAERSPAWSPDGKWIACVSDASGEYQLTLLPADGTGEARTLSHRTSGFLYRPVWSPDSRRLAFRDSAGGIYVHSLSPGVTVKVDQDAGAPAQPRLSWSPDSMWIAYIKSESDGGLLRDHRSLWLYHVPSGRSRQVTSGHFDDRRVSFDPVGQYLFFTSARAFSPDFKSSEVLFEVPLRAVYQGPRDRSMTQDGVGDNAQQALRIDLDGFERRAVQLPIPSGDFGDLAVTDDSKLVYQRHGDRNAIQFFDLKDGSGKERTVAEGVDEGYALSRDGRKILIRADDRLGILDLAPDQKLDHPLPLNGMALTIDQAAEWRQIFTEAWRLCRDFFYDPHMHGVGWPAIRERYAKLLPHCASRQDLNDVIGAMLSELKVDHISISGGNVEELPPISTPVGMLGVDFELDHGAYRIAKIYEGAPWDVDARGPLSQPGVKVKAGDYLLAVNGVPIDTRKDPWAAFQGQAGRDVTLTVSDKPVIDASAREIVVKPLESERDLRYRAWVEERRSYVARQTGGRVGYVCMPDTGDFGMSELGRQFSEEKGREALIIDERWNTGGWPPVGAIELLSRPVYYYWSESLRSRGDFPVPDGQRGPKCMLINGICVSGGDQLAYLFREAGLGKLVGTHTWGGFTAPGSFSLIDGGSIAIPVGAYHDMSGRWLDGHGVEPDIGVIDDPAKMVNGGDPQLDATIHLMLEELRRHPSAPVRSGRPPSPGRRGPRRGRSPPPVIYR